jgi:hypothetical protein
MRPRKLTFFAPENLIYLIQITVRYVYLYATDFAMEIFQNERQQQKIFREGFHGLKGIVSRDFVVVSFDRSDISTHQEWVLLLLKVRFCIEFFDFRVRP